MTSSATRTAESVVQVSTLDGEAVGGSVRVFLCEGCAQYAVDSETGRVEHAGCYNVELSDGPSFVSMWERIKGVHHDEGESTLIVTIPGGDSVARALWPSEQITIRH